MGSVLKQGLLTGALTMKTHTLFWCCCSGAGSAGLLRYASPAFRVPQEVEGWSSGQRGWFTTDLVCDSKCLLYHYTPSTHEGSHGRGDFQVLPRHTRAVHSLAWKRRLELLLTGLHFCSSYCTSRNNTPEEINPIKNRGKVFTVKYTLLLWDKWLNSSQSIWTPKTKLLLW